ncbi:MAG: nicotinate-nicotinamide nucleotide adenylyltransferase [Acidobacteria bacterium]|nr:nicotinate-nicotinamide nucleotide adenylyltransferase [Acidobacteriota bacterium]
MEHFTPIIERTRASEKPTLHFIKQARHPSPSVPQRLGIFAASFNPLTTAHLELMRRAKAEFALDEMLALASVANADKRDYECSLDDRLQMLELALHDDAQTSIGLSSHAFFVDTLDALAAHFTAPTALHFILGFDTFERLLDGKDQYTKLYYRKFSNRLEALDYLLSRSRLIVAGRAGAKHQQVYALASQLPQRLAQRLAYLDFPDELAEQSATAVRARVRADLPIDGLVPQSVAQYIKERGLYVNAK